MKAYTRSWESHATPDTSPNAGISALRPQSGTTSYWNFPSPNLILLPSHQIRHLTLPTRLGRNDPQTPGVHLTVGGALSGLLERFTEGVCFAFFSRAEVEMSPLRVAVIGCGGRSRSSHLPFL